MQGNNLPMLKQAFGDIIPAETGAFVWITDPSWEKDRDGALYRLPVIGWRMAADGQALPVLPGPPLDDDNHFLLPTPDGRILAGNVSDGWHAVCDDLEAAKDHTLGPHFGR